MPAMMLLAGAVMISVFVLTGKTVGLCVAGVVLVVLGSMGAN